MLLIYVTAFRKRNRFVDVYCFFTIINSFENCEIINKKQPLKEVSQKQSLRDFERLAKLLKIVKKLEKVPGKKKYLLESYQGGYVNIKLFLILILAVNKTNSP